MKRLQRVLVVFIVLFSGSSSSWCAPRLHVGSYLQNPRTDEMTIRWETTESCPGSVEYGLDTKSTHKVEGPISATHEIVLKGLKPDTQYQYRCIFAATETPWHTFTTSPGPEKKKFRIAVYGDNRSQPEVHQRICEMVHEQNPALILNSGDLVVNGNDYPLWKREFFDPAKDLFAEIPILTVLGNHESNSHLYYNYFSLPNNEQWWSTHFGNAHIIGLNSCAPTDPESEQTRWLEQELSGPRSDWTIVFFHHPAFSFNPQRPINDTRWNWQPLFQKYGVDLVVAGHDHQYGRSWPVGLTGNGASRGVVHITCGGGGAHLYPVGDFIYSAFARSCHNFMILDFDGNQMKGTAYDFDGKVIDTYTIDKAAKPGPEEFVSWEMIQLERDIRKWEEKKAVMADHETAVQMELKNVFSETATGTMIIKSCPEGWETSVEPKVIILKPGEESIVKFQASRSAKALEKAVPVFELTLLSNKATSTGHFRNSSIEFCPFRGYSE